MTPYKAFLNFVLVLIFGTKTKLEGFVWSQQGISGIDIISIVQLIQTVSFVNYIFGVLSFSSAST